MKQIEIKAQKFSSFLSFSLFFLVFSCKKENVERVKESSQKKQINKVYRSKPVTNEMYNNLTETEWVLKEKQIFKYSANGDMKKISTDTSVIGKIIFFDKKDFKIKDSEKRVIGSFNKSNLQ